jgi:hypothetical protein
MTIFLVFHKNGLIKRYSSFEDVLVHKMSWSHAVWCKFCMHLKSMNVCHFGMVEAMRMKGVMLRSPSMSQIPY